MVTVTRRQKAMTQGGARRARRHHGTRGPKLAARPRVTALRSTPRSALCAAKRAPTCCSVSVTNDGAWRGDARANASRDSPKRRRKPHLAQAIELGAIATRGAASARTRRARAAPELDHVGEEQRSRQQRDSRPRASQHAQRARELRRAARAAILRLCGKRLVAARHLAEQALQVRVGRRRLAGRALRSGETSSHHPAHAARRRSPARRASWRP